MIKEYTASLKFTKQNENNNKGVKMVLIPESVLYAFTKEPTQRNYCFTNELIAKLAHISESTLNVDLIELTQ